MTLVEFILKLNHERLSEEMFPEYSDDGFGGIHYNENSDDEQNIADRVFEAIKYVVEEFNKKGTLNNNELVSLLHNITLNSYCSSKDDLQNYIQFKEKGIPFKNVEKRRTGRSTRLADEYIQYLFNYGSVTILDHENGKHSYLFDLVERRLNIEHNHHKFEFDRKRSTIKVKI